MAIKTITYIYIILHISIRHYTPKPDLRYFPFCILLPFLWSVVSKDPADAPVWRVQQGHHASHLWARSKGLGRTSTPSLAHW